VAYDPSIVAAIRREAARVNDPHQRSRFLRAALQTGIVESGLRNLSYGDADSQGWRQERSSLYKNPTNVGASVRRFFQEAAQLDRGQPSWQLAADVQRPAAQFRGRYHDVAAQAAKLVGGSVGSDGASVSRGSEEVPVGQTQAALLKLTAPPPPQVQVPGPARLCRGRPAEHLPDAADRRARDAAARRRRRAGGDHRHAAAGAGVQDFGGGGHFSLPG
jgi:hypothetical protein